MTYLHLNVQDAHPSLLRNVAHRLDARAIAVVSKLGVLDEALLVYQRLEGVLGHEVVLAAVLLAGARCPCGVGYAEAELVGVLFKQALEDGGLAGATGARDDDCAVGIHGGRVPALGVGVVVVVVVVVSAVSSLSPVCARLLACASVGLS
jgi:hypothetical protein